VGGGRSDVSLKENFGAGIPRTLRYEDASGDVQGRTASDSVLLEGGEEKGRAAAGLWPFDTEGKHKRG